MVCEVYSILLYIYVHLLIATVGFECREDFFRETTFNSCVPICPSWKQDTKAVTTFIDVVVIMAYSAGFIGSVIILVIAGIKNKTM